MMRKAVVNPDSDLGRDDERERPWRPASSGASFVYVVPCLGEDILKLGMSRDPLSRFQALNPRYFDFFDFDSALLVETDSVREARAIELKLRNQLREHNAPAPLMVSTTAGGDTEWYRGALGHLTKAAQGYSDAGHVVHRPLGQWIATALRQRRDLLFHWSTQMLQAIEDAGPSNGLSAPLGRTLRDGLDAYAAFGLDPGDFVPDRVRAWYAS